VNGEVIKTFLVGLGFAVDDKSLKNFNKAMDNAYVRMTLIAGGITAAATGIFAGISQISDGFEKMGYEYRIIAPMINRQIMLRNALLKLPGNWYQHHSAVQQSGDFQFSLSQTKFN